MHCPEESGQRIEDCASRGGVPELEIQAALRAKIPTFIGPFCMSRTANEPFPTSQSRMDLHLHPFYIYMRSVHLTLAKSPRILVSYECSVSISQFRATRKFPVKLWRLPFNAGYDEVFRDRKVIDAAIFPDRTI